MELKYFCRNLYCSHYSNCIYVTHGPAPLTHLRCTGTCQQLLLPQLFLCILCSGHFYCESWQQEMCNRCYEHTLINSHDPKIFDLPQNRVMHQNSCHNGETCHCLEQQVIQNKTIEPHHLQSPSCMHTLMQTPTSRNLYVKSMYQCSNPSCLSNIKKFLWSGDKFEECCIHEKIIADCNECILPSVGAHGSTLTTNASPPHQSTCEHKYCQHLSTILATVRSGQLWKCSWPGCRQRHPFSTCLERQQITDHINRHVNTMRLNRNYKWECVNSMRKNKPCLYSTLNLDLAKRHMRTEHFGIQKPQQKQSHVCGMCQKPHTYQSKLARHMKTHTKERPFQCHNCGDNFTQKSSLQSHSNCCKREGCCKRKRKPACPSGS